MYLTAPALLFSLSRRSVVSCFIRSAKPPIDINNNYIGRENKKGPSFVSILVHLYAKTIYVYIRVRMVVYI